MYTYNTEEYKKNYSRLVRDRKKSESEPYMFLTPEWCSLYEKTIQEDARYKEVAKKWEGSVALVIKAEPDSGLDRDMFLFLDLWHGQCSFAAIVPPETGRNAEFVLEAGYQRWKKIINGELNVVKEIAIRKLRLVPFDFKKAVKLAGAAQAAIRLVELAGEVGVLFADEQDEEKREGYRTLFEDLRANFGI